MKVTYDAAVEVLRKRSRGHRAQRASAHLATVGGENMRRKSNGLYPQYKREHIMNISFVCQSAKEMRLLSTPQACGCRHGGAMPRIDSSAEAAGRVP